MDYGQEYQGYWSPPKRWDSPPSENLDTTVEQILALCGNGSFLDVGCGRGFLALALLKRGLEAHGIDVAETAIADANRQAPGRFKTGSILEIPFPSESFATILSTLCLEHLAPADIPRALAELRRVAQRFVFIQLATIPDRERRWHRTIRDRSWWEQWFFEAGFRKHPSHQTILPYESLEHEGSPITLVFEKIPQAALIKHPLASLKAERDLHMDMLRESGRRADAHVARYQWAKDFVQGQEIILDAACGLGYGSALLACAEPSARIVGIDSSAYAVDYARSNFGPGLANLEFREGDICQLSAFADESVGVVVSFETLEHLPEPEIFLAEVKRVLKPGGCFISSVPNLWLDQHGQDPNPWHFQVFDFARLAGLCRQFFSLRSVCRQNAGGSLKCPESPRLLRPVNLPITSGHDEVEWWLAVCVKDAIAKPSGAAQSRSGTVIALTGSAEHPLYQSWMKSCDLPVRICQPSGMDFQFPPETTVVVTTETYGEPGVTLIRKAVEENIPTLILADGILEYRNTWEHPQIVPGALFQPVLGHKIACIGRSQARWLESWGNGGKCEVVGLPHLDRYADLKRRKQKPDDSFRVLVLTAKTPYFNERQHALVRESLLDLKSFFAGNPAGGVARLEPVWRLTKGLADEIGVSSRCDDLSGRELAEVLQSVDAVISTPSTAMLEAMLLGLPVALLDYCNVPHYVQPAWRITAQSQINEVMLELANPPEPKMLFQETSLHDSLECASPATPRMARLILEMAEAGRRARETSSPLALSSPVLSLTAASTHCGENRFRPALLYPGHAPFAENRLSTLQAEVGHLRKYAAELETRVCSASGEQRQKPSDLIEEFSFLSHLPMAKMARGKPEQKAVWEVTLDGACVRSLYLQPPAELLFEVPTPAAGELITAVAIHPDAWDKPGAGGCEFHVRVDGRLAFVVAIDPANVPEDRNWHEIHLPIPHNSSRMSHQIMLETRSIGTNSDFRWALWREPRFLWKPISLAEPETALEDMLEVSPAIAISDSLVPAHA